MRRLSLVAAACAVLFASACGGGGGASSGGGDPIVVGLVPPTNGSLAVVGKEALNGWRLAVDQANAAGGIDGRPVELVTLESDGNPANTVRAVRQAVTQQGAMFIGAVTTTPEVAAVNQQLDGLNVLSLSATAQDDSLVGAACTANSFQLTPSVSMLVNAMADRIKDMPGDRWAIQAVDYSTGHTVATQVKAAIEAAGKQVVTEQYAPQGATEFGSYISQLQASGADALFLYEQGADGVAFVRQAEQFGLLEQMQTTLGFNTFFESSLTAMGDAVVGDLANLPYDVSADNQANKDFVAAYQTAYGAPPYYVPALNYQAAQALFQAIRTAGSTDTEAVRTALSGMSFDSVSGAVTMRGDDHQLLMPVHLGKIVKNGDRYGYEVLDSAPADAAPAANPACVLAGGQ